MHVNELFSLKGKVILVTGGAGRYGKCIVEGLAEAGGTVISASRNLEATKESVKVFRDKGLDVQALQVDQGDQASVMALKEQIKKQLGKLDVFVNNAVSRPMKNYDAPMDEFSESMRVNATGMVDLMREMTDLMIQNGSGSI